MRTVLAIGILAVVLGAVTARGADDDKPACLAETQRLCPLVPVGLVQACLQAHQSELSPECRKHLSRVNDEIDRMSRDCSGDLARFCTEPQTRAGQRAECLTRHRDDLSQKCRDTLDAMSAK